MEKHIHGKPPILHKIVFELRYLYGYTYLDRCGRTINAIMREAPEWIPKDQGSPQNTPLLSVGNNCLFNFSALKMDFSIEQPIESQIESRDVELFKGQVDLLSRIVIDQLELKEFTRIGLRAWYLFRGQDKPEAETWLRNLGLYTISGNLETAFGGKIESVGMSVVLAGEDRKFRIAMNGVERGAQVDRGAEVIVIRSSSLSKNQDKYFKEQLRRKGSLRAMPEFASMIDVDAFQDDPISIDPRDFIETSLDQFMDRLWKAIPHP